MEIRYTHITEVKPSELILKKDGTIFLVKDGCRKQTIGNWDVSYPKREAKAKGLLQREYTERFYSGGIPYKGTASGYTRDEFKECICSIIARRGIDVIDL